MFPFLRQGQCFVAINPEVYADGFGDRMQSLMDQYRNLEPVCMRYVILTGIKGRRLNEKQHTMEGFIIHTDRHAHGHTDRYRD